MASTVKRMRPSTTHGIIFAGFVFPKPLTDKINRGIRDLEKNYNNLKFDLLMRYQTGIGWTFALTNLITTDVIVKPRVVKDFDTAGKFLTECGANVDNLYGEATKTAKTRRTA